MENKKSWLRKLGFLWFIAGVLCMAAAIFFNNSIPWMLASVACFYVGLVATKKKKG